MGKYAEIMNDVVQSVVEPTPGFAIGQCFEPSFVARLAPCPDEVEPGWTHAGGKFAPPVEPTPSLDEAKALALAALRAKRLEVEYGGFDFDGRRWDSSEKDELRLNSIIKAFEMTGQPEFPGWKAADGLYITLTPAIAQQAAITLMRHYARAFQVEAVKAAQIAALDTAEAALAWRAEALDSGW